MRKIVFIIAATLISISVSAQDYVSPVINCQGRTTTIDVRDFYGGQTYQDISKNAPIRSDSTLQLEGYRWIDRIHNMPEYLNVFYQIYGNMVNDVLQGKSNCLSDPNMAPIKTPNGQYCIDIHSINNTFNIPIPVDADAKQIGTLAATAIRDSVQIYYDEISCFMPYLFTCMSYDYPQAFWIGSKYRWGESYGYQYSYWTQGPKAGICKIDLEFQSYLMVKTESFDFRIDEFNSDSAVAHGVTVFNEAIDSILSNLPNTTRCAQLKYFNEWLTTHNCYSTALGTDSVPTIIWSPISALTGNVGPTGPVCEGYARAFKVLCDIVGIPNVLAVGNARLSLYQRGEDHMWNEVQMDDSLWYGVDVTWNDPVVAFYNTAKSGFETEKWLLVGKNDTINSLTFEQSHPNSIIYRTGNPDNWDFKYESFLTEKGYDISTVVLNPQAKTSELVKVYSITGTLLGTFNSIDEATRSTSPGLYIIGNRKILIK